MNFYLQPQVCVVFLDNASDLQNKNWFKIELLVDMRTKQRHWTHTKKNICHLQAICLLFFSLFHNIRILSMFTIVCAFESYTRRLHVSFFS